MGIVMTGSLQKFHLSEQGVKTWSEDVPILKTCPTPSIALSIPRILEVFKSSPLVWHPLIPNSAGLTPSSNTSSNTSSHSVPLRVGAPHPSFSLTPKSGFWKSLEGTPSGQWSKFEAMVPIALRHTAGHEDSSRQLCWGHLGINHMKSDS